MTRRTARTAAALAWACGLGFGLPGLYAVRYLADHGTVWYFLGFPTYGEGPFESAGLATSVPLLVAFVLLCGAEVVMGALLWRRRRAGEVLAWALLPAEVAFWTGFALPFGFLAGAGRTGVLLAARSAGAAVLRSLREGPHHRDVGR